MSISPSALSPVPGSTSPDNPYANTAAQIHDRPAPKKITRYGRPRPLEPSSDTVIPSTSSECLSERFAAKRSSWLKGVGSLGVLSGTSGHDDEDGEIGAPLFNGSKYLDKEEEEEVDDEEPTNEEALAYLQAQRSAIDRKGYPALGAGSSTSDLTSLPSTSPTPAAPALHTGATQLLQTSSLTNLSTSDNAEPISTPLAVHKSIPPFSAPLSPISVHQHHAAAREMSPISRPATQPSPSPSNPRALVETDETIKPFKMLPATRKGVVLSDEEDEESDIVLRKPTARTQAVIFTSDEPDVSAQRRDMASGSDSDDSLASVGRIAVKRAVKIKSATAPPRRIVQPAIDFGSDDEAIASTAAPIASTHKPLNQKELTQMRKGIVQTKNERRYYGIQRSEHQFPVGDFLERAKANTSLSSGFKTELKIEMPPSSIHSDDNFNNANDVPDLAASQGTAVSSPINKTPVDDIETFSSGSGKLHFERQPQPSPSLMAQRDALKMKKERLVAALKKRQVRPLTMRPQSEEDDDDDTLVIVRETPERTSLFDDYKPIQPRLRSPTAPKAKVSRALNQLQQNLNIKPPSHVVVTESYVNHAGHRFAHGDDKVKQGARRDQGGAANKSTPIGTADLSRYLLVQDRKDAVDTSKKKEEAWGTKIKELPEKEKLDLSSFPSGVDQDEMESGDEEDEEYNPEHGSEAGDGSEAEGDAQGHDVTMAYSGDEDEGPHAQSDAEVSDDEDKENQPPASDSDMEDADATPLARPRPSKNVIQSPPASPPAFMVRQSLNSKLPAKTTLTSPVAFGGDDDGFSQLFGDTQVDEPAGDGFAGLRQQAAVLLPAHLLLPSNDISATQIERDNALVAAEADADIQMAVANNDESLPRYLNDEGFFTQTKPAESQSLASDVNFYSNVQGSLLSESMTEAAFSATYVSAAPAETQDEFSGQLQRLKKREGSFEASKRTSSPDGQSSLDGQSLPVVTSPVVTSPIVSEPVKPNVNDILAEGERRRARRNEVDAKHADEFLEGEAEESDEDDIWGGGTKEEEDEEDEEENQGYVEGLVDDVARTAVQAEADEIARREKQRELDREEEERALKAAQEVAAGEWKRKKRGLEDFEASDDEDTKKISRKEKKKRKKRVEGVDDVETESFQVTINAGLDGSDDETDDGLEASPPSIQEDSDAPKLSAEQARRSLLEVKQRERVLSPPPHPLSEEDMPSGFIISRGTRNGLVTRSPKKPSEGYAVFLRNEGEKGNSTRRATGQSSSVVSAQVNSKPSRGPARPKSQSASSLRSNSSLSRLEKRFE